jgi:predicted ATPase
MITSWTLGNFKSVYRRTELKLAPITLFVGANNAGKSTFIQSMLLVAQTLNDQLTSRSIVLNGRMTRAGSFSGIVSSDSGKHDVTIGFRAESPVDQSADDIWPHSALERRAYHWGPPDHHFTVDCEFSFSSPGVGTRDALDLQTTVTESRVAYSETLNEQPQQVHVRRSKRAGELRGRTEPSGFAVARSLPDSLAYEVLSPRRLPEQAPSSWDYFPIDGSIVGATLIHFVPRALTVEYDENVDYAKKLVMSLLSGNPRRPFRQGDDRTAAAVRAIYSKYLESIRLGIDNVSESLPAYRRKRILAALETAETRFDAEGLLALSAMIRSVPEVRAVLAIREKEFVDVIAKTHKSNKVLGAVPILSQAYAAIQYTFGQQFRYLGPLRDEPKAVYPFDGLAEPGSVGLRGEYTAAALDLYKDLDVTYVTPPTSTVASGPNSRSRATLSIALSAWLDYLGVVQSVRTEDKGIFGHELSVAVHGDTNYHTLPHVGVGVSQVLPILVMSLLSNPGTTLVFEQPELHLHPSVQARLADFFLALSSSGRQCIVETHSEYLINRFRLRAAESADERVSDSLRIYFVEKTGRESTYRTGSITPLGTMKDWPDGFFDQGPRDSRDVLVAAMRKRMREQKDTGQL